jgi:hypothetical protein
MPIEPGLWERLSKLPHKRWWFGPLWFALGGLVAWLIITVTGI